MKYNTSTKILAVVILILWLVFCAYLWKYFIKLVLLLPDLF